MGLAVYKFRSSLFISRLPAQIYHESEPWLQLLNSFSVVHPAFSIPHPVFSISNFKPQN